MKYLYIILLVCLSLSYSCNEESGSQSVDVQTRCFTPTELFASDCPTELLSNMCSTLSCGFTIGNLAGDGFFPNCPSDYFCESIDCNTLNCGQVIYNISTGESGLSYFFDTVDQSTGEAMGVRVTCHEGGIFSSSCEG